MSLASKHSFQTSLIILMKYDDFCSIIIVFSHTKVTFSLLARKAHAIYNNILAIHYSHIKDSQVFSSLRILIDVSITLFHILLGKGGFSRTAGTDHYD